MTTRLRHLAGPVGLAATALLLTEANPLLESRTVDEAGSAAYTIVSLGTLGGNISEAYALSENGFIGGTAHRATAPTKTAFVYSNGMMTDLGVIGDANAVNDFGEAAGRMLVGPCCNQTHAFRFDGTQVMDLGTLGGTYSEAYAINSSGDIVGYSQTSDFNYHGFLFSEGTMVDLGTPGGTYSWAYDINDFGIIVGEGATPSGGSQAFAYEDGVFTSFAPPGAEYSYAFAINNVGQITGGFQSPDSPWQLGFIYDNGTFTAFGGPGVSADPYGINDWGQVVGYSQTAPGVYNAFLYQNGVLTDLNDLLPDGSGWVLREAWDINNAGVIVGVGYFNGDIRAFMMTPVGATQPGSTVVVTPTVELPGGGTTEVAVTFDTVDEGGATRVTALDTEPVVPEGFQLTESPLYFDVETTATFSGPVELCFSWPEGAVANEADARLLHYENSAWTDVTTSVDTDANVICGEVTSLSPFVIVEASYVFIGFAPPMLADGSASIHQGKQGRTIPLKFRLERLGLPVDDAIATLEVFKVLDIATGSVDTTDLTADAGQSGDGGNQFRYDPDDGLYVFNLSTKGWQAPATYRIVVTLDDGSEHSVEFSLR